MTGWGVALAAATLGVFHAVLLRRSARFGPDPVAMFVRLLLVAVVLGLAAASGWLAAGAVGWAAGFAGGTLVLAWRWR